MIYVLMGFSIFVIILGVLLFKADNEECGCALSVLGSMLFIIVLIIFVCLLARYNSIKSSAKEQITVYEEQNKIVLEQLEPLVNKYMHFEKNTFKDLKLSSERLLLLSQAYPELKSNTFVETQINVILYNQREISKLKLSMAKLNAYKLWIGLGAY